MSPATVLAIVASSFGVVMGLAPSLQIRRMLTEHSSRDVSIGYFAIIALGSVLWGSYGASIANFAIVIPNVVGCAASIATILVAHRLRRRERLDVPEVGRPAGPGGGLAPLSEPEIALAARQAGSCSSFLM